MKTVSGFHDRVGLLPLSVTSYQLLVGLASPVISYPLQVIRGFWVGVVTVQQSATCNGSR